MTRPGRDPAPLTTAEDAERFFTEVPPTRSASAAAPTPRTVGTAARWSWTTRRRVGAATVLGGAVLGGAVLVVATVTGPAARSAEPPPSRSAATTTPASAPASASGVAASAESGAGETTAAHWDNLANAGVGNCFESVPTSVLEVQPVLACNSPYAYYLVTRKLPLTGDPASGGEVLPKEGNALCVALLTDPLGFPPAPADYGVTVPSTGEWEKGYRSAYCLVAV